MRVLVTGATGYIGGRLIPQLLERGHRVRVLVRDIDRIRGRAWAGAVDAVVGDLLQPRALTGVCNGIDAVYYLIHSMSAGADFARRDLAAATNYARVAERIPLTIYLGGLLPEGGGRSPHLRSRAEVGTLLRAAAPTTEIRAGPIVGSGSASFELVRYLTERHPLMLVPRCAGNAVQPIAVRDVLSYLLAALEQPPLGVMDVGGERLSFADMLLQYAALRGLSRRLVPLRFITPDVVACWAGTVTPVPQRIARPLLQGMLVPVIADTSRASACFPAISPLSYRCAVELALGRIEAGRVETRWSGALAAQAWSRRCDRINPVAQRPDVPALPQAERAMRRLVDCEGMMAEVRSRHVAARPEQVHAVVSGLGGEHGWLVWNRIWWVRGLIDRLLGGPGLRRGRRHPTELLPGEAVDFWRVEQIHAPHLLRLRAEMKVPGCAWLQWETVREGDGARLVQTALFQPDGLSGFLYWYLLYPIHAAMFSRLVHAVSIHARRTPLPFAAERPSLLVTTPAAGGCGTAQRVTARLTSAAVEVAPTARVAAITPFDAAT